MCVFGHHLRHHGPPGLVPRLIRCAQTMCLSHHHVVALLVPTQRLLGPCALPPRNLQIAVCRLISGT